MHSPAYRRLQGKTQLFPGIESDFFRNRLTHSIEVAQIAKSIALRINATDLPGKRKTEKIDLDLVSLAGMAHDLGHPPFGHNGEKALDYCMKDHGGFEGNAQTLRILARLEKKGADIAPFSGPGHTDKRVGLNLTYRTLAAILKYDQVIPIESKDRSNPDKICKGYYFSEVALVETIKKKIIGRRVKPPKFKTIECQIMDVADDIAYSTYDLEDALKAGFISPMEILADAANRPLMEKVVDELNKRSSGKEYSFTDVIRSLLQLFFATGLFDQDKILGHLSA
ncbi:MAG TPA: dNTP triphosphohydrolase, partial [Methylophilaceae bacterium]